MKGRGLPAPVDRVLLYFFHYNFNIQKRSSIRQKQPGISGKNHRGGNMN